MNQLITDQRLIYSVIRLTTKMNCQRANTVDHSALSRRNKTGTDLVGENFAVASINHRGGIAR